MASDNVGRFSADGEIVIDGDSLTLDQVRRVAKGGRVRVAPEAREKMLASRSYIDERVKAGDVIYGVNTGFGAFSSVRIPYADIIQLQKNLIRSHCAGVGEPFSVEETRAIMLLRANALCRGHSGVRPLLVDKLVEFINKGIHPRIPQQGSVGASGDLAPLAHLALALIGEGSVFSDDSHSFESSEKALERKGVLRLELEAKEGLALINGCQVMTAVGLMTAFRCRDIAWLSDVAGAISLEALRGSRKAFHPLIAPTRPHPGEAKTARNLMRLLTPSSEIAESHTNCNKVQDAYSLRCMPAVHGAAKDVLGRTIETLLIEANSSTDNPLVFANEGEVLSCGNFHGEPVAFALDFLAIAISAMASQSECRIEKLINPAMSELAAFLAPKGGLNSGHMIVQVAAASLVSENKILSHPASVDSIPTSADKEDHVSMGTIAARKLRSIQKNAEHILAMELLCGTQALDLLSPLRPAKPLSLVYKKIREKVPFAAEDRIFSEDIDSIVKLVDSGELLKVVRAEIGELEI